MWTGSVSPYIRPKARGGLRPKRNLERRAARRAVLDGYPVDARAMSLDEIRQYFAGDRIICLRCGRKFKRLGNHLSLHGMSEDDYRVMYGLPFRRGLNSDESRERYRQATLRNMPNGPGALVDAETFAAWRAKAHNAHQRWGAFRQQVAQVNGRKMAKAPYVYDGSTYEMFLSRVAEGRTRVEACSDPDMPGLTWIVGYEKAHPEARQKFDDLWESLPFSVQARAGRMGARAIDRIKELRGEGHSDHTIARLMGVTAMAINRQRKKSAIP